MSLKPEIILVGTFHFEQQVELIKEREFEIEKLAGYLSEFKPSKIAVEWQQPLQKDLTKRFLETEKSYGQNEIEQIGFRIAKKLKLKNVQAIDYEGNLTPEDMEKLYGAISSRYPAIQKELADFSEKDAQMDEAVSLYAIFESLNNPSQLSVLERIYLSFISVAENEEYIGAEFLRKWNWRELMIFKHVVDVIDSPKERVLLLIGRDHLWSLKKLFEGRGYRVINPFAASLEVNEINDHQTN
ncbi:DUF5694 domain-containing protein [Planococcus liqunii]|uniref:DUF5694 domain-containing protein n=1 Tax=Planococcus liqunii TaxID=3058394 RepID=UPI002632C3E3|nr:DUF5694 domain-containing protein [Planococcus sp. N056]WKA52839.1 DUF5694 domain-containing protein [Planococcus sp. N056]